MKFKEIKIIHPDVYTDLRGDLWTLWREGDDGVIFNHDKASTSKKNVLRGIHGDYKSTKRVTCLLGELLFVVVDNRPESPTYLQWDKIILDDKKRLMVQLPPGFGNAFLVLSDNSIFHYKWSYTGAYPDVDDQFTIKWNDQRLSIDWPIDNPILQLRDK